MVGELSGVHKEGVWGAWNAGWIVRVKYICCPGVEMLFKQTELSFVKKKKRKGRTWCQNNTPVL